MPYIDAQTRADLAPELNRLIAVTRNQPEGALNYVITRLLIAWMGPKPNYPLFNAAIGVLGCAKLELYRRMVAPYEGVKRGENGDVYPPILDYGLKGGLPHERE